MILCLSKLSGEAGGVKPKTAPFLDVRWFDATPEVGREVGSIPSYAVLKAP